MNSFHKLSGYGQRSVIALMIISTFALSIAAQTVVRPQTQGRMYGGAGFVGETINLNVVNADIRDILNYITEQYGVNFVIDKSVAAVPVTVNVNDVPWDIALDSVLRAQGLGVQVNGTILRIADQKTLASEQDVLVKIRDSQLDTSPLLTEFIRLNFARAEGTLQAVAEESGQGRLTTGSAFAANVPGGTLYGSTQDVLNDASIMRGQRRSITSNSGGAGILGIIQKRLSRRGSVEVDKRTNTLIVTDVRENIDAVRQLVALLDQPEPQVEIEARIVVATRGFSRDLGIQLAALVTGPRGSGGFGGTLPVSGVPSNVPGQPNGSLGLADLANTVVGLTTGIFGTAQISALLAAGEQQDRAKVIATPRVTTLNNRPAEIKSGSKIPIQTVQGGTGGDPIITTEYVEVPLRLSITPQIPDVGMVILNVVAENSTVSSVSRGGTPEIDTQSMKTEVTVPDGGTTVIGGVLSDRESEGVNRTPGISRIPVLGNLFKRKGVARSTSEILFFITPRIQRPDFIGSERRATTIIQPVPLGNPSSNSDQAPMSQPPAQPTVPALRP